MGKGGGKSAGKILFTVAGFFLGGGYFTALKAANWLSGAVLGASLFGSIWSATHTNKASNNYNSSPDIQRFDKAQETMSSTATIPVVYGYRKLTGNQTYHYTNADQNTLHKHVVLCEGGIQGIESVSANDLLIPTGSQTGNTVFTIQNRKYSDAWVMKKGKTLTLYANGQRKDLYLANKDDAQNADTLWSWQTSISELITYINKIGNGWEAFPTATTGNYPGNMWDVHGTNNVYVGTASFWKKYSSFTEGGYYYEFQYGRQEKKASGHSASGVEYSHQYRGYFKKYRQDATGVGCYNNPINFQTSTVTGGTNYTFYDSVTPTNYDEVGGYPKMAWLDMNFVVSSELNGNPSVSCFVKGRKVYDTRTGTTAYSTNPAMCLRDFILSKRYGLGKWIDSSHIDEDSFKEVANYCDEIITYTGSSGETISCKRYELNIVIDQKQSALDWVTDILGNFCGFLVFSQDKLFLRIEKPESTAYKFNDSNCSDLSVAPLSLDDTPNRYEITFIDPLNNWNSVEALVEDFADQKARQKIITKSVSLEGTTSQNQALRLARFYRDYNTVCYKTISFKTGQQAMHLEPGDVIELSYHNVFKNEPFRITEIKENNDGTYEIAGRSYNKNIYNDYLGATIQVYDYSDKQTSLSGSVPEVTKIELSQRYYINGDGSVVSDILGNFTLPTYDYFHRAFIYFAVTGDTEEITDNTVWEYYGSTSGNKFVINNAKTKKWYTFKIIVENTSGRRSEGVLSDDYYITGKDEPPSDITEGRVWYDPKTNQIQLLWTATDDPDIKCYEIQDENNDVLDTTISTNYTTYIYDDKPHTFYIYAIDNGGNKSNNPLVLVAQRDIATDPPTEIQVVQDNINLSQLNISWGEVDDDKLDYYTVYVNEQKVGTTKFTSYKYLVESSGKYLIGISTTSVFTAESDKITEEITIKIEPEDVPVLTMIQSDTDRSNLQFSWTEVPHGVKYELRQGKIWDSAKFIASTSNLSYTYQLRTEGNYTFLVKAIGYNEKYSVNAATLNKQLILKPNPPTNISITQNTKDRTNLDIAWTAPSGHDIAGYEIYINNVLIDTTTTSSYSYALKSSQSVAVSIIAYTVAGFKSTKANKNYTATLEPLDVTGFTATQNPTKRSEIHFLWDSPNEGDISHYEIRVGKTWDDSTVVSSRILNTFYDASITQEGSLVFWIKAVSIAGYYSLYPAKTTTDFDLNPTAPTNIVLTQNSSDSSTIDVSWDAVSDLDVNHYEVRYGSVWVTAKTVAITSNAICSFKPNDTSGDVTVLIKTMNNSGFYSPAASASLYANYEPEDVKDFIAYQNGDYVEFTWSKADSADIVGYEIREGYSWETATILETMITGLSYKIQVTYEATFKYMIKAINHANKYSVIPATQSVKVENLSNKNIILSISELALRNGIHDNTEFGNSIYNWQTLGGRFSDWTNVMFSETGNSPAITDAERQYYLFSTIGGRWSDPQYAPETWKSIVLRKILRLKKQSDGTFASSGTYLCQTIDVKQIISASIAVKYHSTSSFLSGISAYVEFRTSRDKEIWTNWRVFSAGQYNFRYAEFRVVMSTTNPNMTPEVNSLEIYIDVPDREETGSIDVPIGGMDITYETPFYIVPIVTPYALGYGIRCEITNKTLTGFKVRVLNEKNEDIGGHVNYRSRGY